MTAPPLTAYKESFRIVAELIAGPNAPLWLTEHLERWVPTLRLAHAVFAKQPTRKEMKICLAKIGKAAEQLVKGLGDVSTREFLEFEGKTQFEPYGALDHALRKIAERAQFARSSLPVHGGRGRAIPQEAVPPKIFCALMVAETWKHVHGHYPGLYSRKAAAAAQALWNAADGKDTSWGDRDSAWWRHFSAAMTTNTEDRAEYCRHLRISQRTSGELGATAT